MYYAGNLSAKLSVALSRSSLDKTVQEEGASMQAIADWLEKLGMSEYAQRFTENGISVTALRHLTDQDLKDIGVLLGHRRTMLAAIAEFQSPGVERTTLGQGARGIAGRDPETRRAGQTGTGRHAEQHRHLCGASDRRARPHRSIA